MPAVYQRARIKKLMHNGIDTNCSIAIRHNIFYKQVNSGYSIERYC
jgi:hypothetical protein